MRRSSFLSAVAAVAAVTCAAGADGASPNLKPGLWERTVARQMEGPPVAPAADLSKLSPERRARVEQAMAARSTTTPSTSVTRYCLAPEAAPTWESFSRDVHDDASCQRTLQDESATTLRMSMVCAGGKQTGTFEFRAVGSDHVSGTITTVQKEERGERRIRIDIDSRWLGPDCGGVKPGQPVRVNG